ncbi:hypothetical protein LSH36_61g01015 [Paralvinella palmiformis]|uniref:Uncharacterized protein n=1 Tax=Paralvinella palmiformis TaxID=53620 RepID=A0AAD9NBV8_9ANNE|nr:hypothetical protein LSH36_61g01015 [Paralvinella palmiformis]
MEDNEAALVAARIERQERNFNQILREEQDAAYLESLRADQEKERKKKEEREAREKEEQARLDEELARQQELENRKRKKDELRNQIPPVRYEDAVKLMYKLIKHI